MTTQRIPGHVEQLLTDAAAARDAGRRDEVHALASAVLALDAGNAAAKELLDSLHQRCQMTLMFCDLAGSTALADGREPEEMGSLLREYRAICIEEIERFGGFVEDRKGDGMLVRFGYPWVHEDDARRAVLSALGIVRRMQERNARLVDPGVPELHLRIAVHTGIVGLDEGEVVGAAPNEAARLQTLAEPDTVVISDMTQALVRGYFDVEWLGAFTLRGVSRTIEVFTVLGERATGRLDAAPSLTPFAGRAAELDLVQRMWHETRAAWATGGAAGSHEPPRVVLVSGSPGIGKSRFVREAVGSLAAPCLSCQCSSYHQTASLHPFRRMLAKICQITDADTPQDRLAKLRARLARAGGPSLDLPLLASALSIPPELIDAPAEMDPMKLRDLALDLAAGLVRSHVAHGPTVLLVDDLHWVDETSLDLISRLLAGPCPGLLLLLATRPGFAIPWPEDRLEQLELVPLADGALEEMARALAESASLDVGQQHDLIERSSGIPLYLEELVRSRAAVGRPREPHALCQPDDAVPVALRDPLLARLVMPGIDLDLAQLAATVGGDIDRELLRRAAGLDDKRFRAKLANLMAAGLIDASRKGTIRFRHELIREVAYQTQRASTRRGRHSRIADLLGGDDAGGPGHAVEAAFHLERAERYPEAIGAQTAIAQTHQALGAHKEAVTELTHVLTLLEHLDVAMRYVTELTVRQLRTFSAVMAGGYSAPETAEDQARCVELCEQLGLSPELLPSLIVSLSYFSFRGDLVEAHRVCDTMCRVVDEVGARLPASEFARGVVSFCDGRFDDAEQHMRSFLDHPWASPPGTAPPQWPLPNDPFVAISSHLYVTRWLRGDPHGAQACADAALERVAGLPFPYGPFSACYLDSQFAIVRRLEGDHAAAAAIAAKMIEVGDRHGFVLWTLAGIIQAGLTAVHLGEHAALEPLELAVGQWRELLSAELWTPYWLTELAAAQDAAGQADAAHASLDDALAVAAVTGCDFYTAETLRIRGVLRCRDGDRGGLADLHDAVRKARDQGATALQTRANRAFEIETARRPATP